MAAMTSALTAYSPNRRRRVRHKIQTPAYATFTAESKSAMLDLHEILDISEDGISIQYASQLDRDRVVNVCLDLADCAEQIYTSGQVIWSSPSGRAGLQFTELSPQALARLREWLFVNVMAGVANSEINLDTPIVPDEPPISAALPDDTPPVPNYTDTLAAVNAVQRQVEGLRSDLPAALQLIVERAQSLVRASGAAIALSDAEPDFMICRASSGPDAPPLGARLQVGSGFSGECVTSGMLLRCNDTELDTRVDRESCRALGIRSMLAAPIRVGEKCIGILETFSAEPEQFSEGDGQVLQRLADTVLGAVNRAAKAEDLPPLEPAANRFAPSPGSVLFASPDGTPEPNEHDSKSPGGLNLRGPHLFILYSVFGAIFLVLGYTTAPLIQSKLKERSQSQTVLANSPASAAEPSAETAPPAPSIETASFEQLKQMAEKRDPDAENALGLRYYTGDDKNGIAIDQREAFRWFHNAAEDGNLSAQSKLGALYWGGRGVPEDVTQAYYWTVLARARGDKESKDRAAILLPRLTRSQAASIEKEAGSWLRDNLDKWKPSAAR